MPNIGNTEPTEMDRLWTKVLEIIPSATFEEDMDGQIIIYTGLMETTGGGVSEFIDTDYSSMDEV